MFEGRVVQIIGPVIDVEFDQEELPQIDTAVTVHVPGRAGQPRGAPVDREFGLAVEDDEHLLHLVVEMMADAPFWRQHAAVQEEQVRAQGLGVEHLHVVELAGASVDALGLAILGGILARDALG